MKLMTQILDIESIQSAKETEYDIAKNAVEIEALAHTIVEAQGLLSIPLVKLVSLENYELLSGDLEFNAYLKALEFDKTLPGRITVYIVGKKDESVARKQMALTRTMSPSPDSKNPPTPDKDNLLVLENIINRLESLDKKVANQESLVQSTDRILTALDATVPESLPMFQAFEHILEIRSGVQVHQNLERILGKSKAQKVIELLKNAKENGQNLGSFSAISSVLKGKKLMSDKRLMEISDDWK